MMEENKHTDSLDESLKLDALYAPTPQRLKADEPIQAKDNETQLTDTEPEMTAQDLTGNEAAAPNDLSAKNVKADKKRRGKGARKVKHPKAPASPIYEPALPLLLATVTFTICLTALIIDRFVSEIGGGLLAPVILQLVALVIPGYLAIMLSSPEKKPKIQMRETGFRTLRAEYIFFVLFSSFFAICASLMLTLAFGGAYDMSQGITLLGAFSAGKNEYTVSIPYLILTYAVIPALAEEFLFRGVIFSRLERVSFPFAATVSTALYALFGFTLGGVIPSLFIGMMSVFVLYTTKTLWSCVLLHFIFNLYRLFLEANISEYFLSSQNNLLLIITLSLALCISALLFFSESARIFRKRAEQVTQKKRKSASKLINLHSVKDELRAMTAYVPSLVFSVICLCIFAAAVVINLVV